MTRGLLSLFSWRYPLYLLRLWNRHHTVTPYFRAYWQTSDFSRLKAVDADAQKDRFTVYLLYVWMGLQIGAGMVLCVWWYYYDLRGGWQFGLAALLAYPLILAHILPVFVGIWWLGHPKQLGRAVLCTMLEAQVRRLRRKHTMSVVAVVGSIGKTSTKIAIARTLSVSRRVQWQEGNYNDRVTVPLIFFAHDEPSIFNIPAWVKILIKNERMLTKPYPYQIVVVELGPDGPGQMKDFAYLKPDVIVVTAVTPEHMEYFKTLDAVAAEELSALHFSKRALVNIDDTPARYLKDREYQSYGLDAKADYHLSQRTTNGLKSQSATFHLGDETVSIEMPLLGDQGAKIALAAAATAHALELPMDDIEKGIQDISAFAGRMQVLYGIRNSTLLDDTYNASPQAAIAALDVLQSGAAPQRIAILGSMNELGDYSPDAHREVGEHCDPIKLDWVITIGQDAQNYLAPVAKARGCQVKSFLNPYKAGRFVKKQLQEGAVVLAKGSQNGVFAEEALKLLLADKADEVKLVRQSAYWMGVKSKQFDR